MPPVPTQRRIEGLMVNPNPFRGCREYLAVDNDAGEPLIHVFVNSAAADEELNDFLEQWVRKKQAERPALSVVATGGQAPSRTTAKQKPPALSVVRGGGR